ncbi:acyltransferase [Flavobacterium sp. W21_SRS_FM6]|uniref:acyltransferase n=1 Tax=Flavobacterium sp. W21_SRS_FM6 TaxID=3240268 RepID=UPI003F90ECEA
MARNNAIDTFRFIAVFAVIIIHTSPFSNLDSGYIYILFNQLSLFAVPYFFIISGYFWGRKLNKNLVLKSFNHTYRFCIKIFTIFIFWSIFYFFDIVLSGSNDNIGFSITNTYTLFTNDLLKLALEGTKVHLWFLPSLIIAALITAVFLYLKRVKSLIFFSIFLYVYGVVAGAYQLNIDLVESTYYRNGPYFSTLLFVTGVLLNQFKINNKTLKLGILIFVSGTVLHFTEIMSLYIFRGIYPTHDYVIGTYFMGLGISLLAISNSHYLQSVFLSRLGKYTLGIYARHLFVIGKLSTYKKLYLSVYWDVIFILIVTVISLILIWFLNKLPFTNKFVK